MNNNGTFAPAIEYIDIEPNTELRKIKKKIVVNGEFVEQVFIMVHDYDSSGPIQQWCSEHYGPSKYGKTWWYTFNSIVMLDKIYTHYLLCK